MNENDVHTTEIYSRAQFLLSYTMPARATVRFFASAFLFDCYLYHLNAPNEHKHERSFVEREDKTLKPSCHCHCSAHWWDYVRVVMRQCVQSLTNTCMQATRKCTHEETEWKWQGQMKVSSFPSTLDAREIEGFAGAVPSLKERAYFYSKAVSALAVWF